MSTYNRDYGRGESAMDCLIGMLAHERDLEPGAAITRAEVVPVPGGSGYGWHLLTETIYGTIPGPRTADDIRRISDLNQRRIITAYTTAVLRAAASADSMGAALDYGGVAPARRFPPEDATEHELNIYSELADMIRRETGPANVAPDRLSEVVFSFLFGDRVYTGTLAEVRRQFRDQLAAPSPPFAPGRLDYNPRSAGCVLDYSETARAAPEAPDGTRGGPAEPGYDPLRDSPDVAARALSDYAAAQARAAQAADPADARDSESVYDPAASERRSAE